MAGYPLRLSDDLKQKAVYLAAKNNISLNTFFCEAIEYAVQKDGKLSESEGEILNQKLDAINSKIDRDGYYLKHFLKNFLLEEIYFAKYIKGFREDSDMMFKIMRNPSLYVSYVVEKLIFEYDNPRGVFNKTDHCKKKYAELFKEGYR